MFWPFNRKRKQSKFDMTGPSVEPPLPKPLPTQPIRKPPPPPTKPSTPSAPPSDDGYASAPVSWDTAKHDNKIVPSPEYEQQRSVHDNLMENPDPSHGTNDHHSSHSSSDYSHHDSSGSVDSGSSHNDSGSSGDSSGGDSGCGGTSCD